MTTQQKLNSDYLPTLTPMRMSPTGKPEKSKFKLLLQFLLLAGIAGCVWATVPRKGCRHDKVEQNVLAAKPIEETCYQAGPVYPGKHRELWANLSIIIGSESFKFLAVDRLSRAVQFE